MPVQLQKEVVAVFLLYNVQNCSHVIVSVSKGTGNWEKCVPIMWYKLFLVEIPQEINKDVKICYDSGFKKHILLESSKRTLDLMEKLLYFVSFH